MQTTPRLLSLVLALALALAAPLQSFAQRSAVEAQHGMVVSVQELASQAGVEIMQKGGNAIDAAVATGFALAVVYPWAGNLGGGGFMLIHLADGRDIAIDYRETAPASASRNMYLDAQGNLLAGPGSSIVGWRASGVPGTVAGFALALEKYGSHKVTWADVIEPARKLAAEGHIVTQYNASRAHYVAPRLSLFAESKRIYLKDGAFLQPGDRWVQPELAATLARLQQHGPREFYEGETAQKIAAAMAANSGTITLADLQGYRAIERVPARISYRGHEIVTMPLPSSSGITLLQMFAMLEPFDLGAMGTASSAKYHLMIEVMRRAYRDRAANLGDPDFVKVPVAGLLDRAYLASVMKSFDPQKSTPSGELPAAKIPGAESMETTHYSVADAAGNAVGNTYTLNGGYGSGVTIPGLGFLMNNEMDDFAAKPGTPNMYKLIQGEGNAIAPGKRPLSSMSPSFVLKDGKVELITGSPGGSTIPTTVLCVITNFIDHHMPVAQAVNAPRIHHQWMPDVVNYEPYGLSEDVIATLKAKGHTLAQRDLYGPTGKGIPLIELYQGDAETLAIDPATHLLLGAADSRKPDARALGY